MDVKAKELELKQFIDENEHYRLHVVRLPDMEVDVYGVVHKSWGVLEMSTSVLANARKFLTMLNEWELNPGKGDVEAALPDLPIGPMN